MKFVFNHPLYLDFFMKEYLPLWHKAGFSWELFPNLTIGINVNPLTAKTGGINWNKEYYNPNSNYIHCRMPTYDELEAIGLTMDQYRMIYPSSLFHEIFHKIHFKYGGEDGSGFWKVAHELSKGKIRLKFGWQDTGNYAWVTAYEDFANYGERIIEGRDSNPAFLDWIKEVVGVKSVTLKEGDYLISKDKDGLDRAYVPIRQAGEALGAEVHWDDKTRQITLVRIENK